MKTITMQALSACFILFLFVATESHGMENGAACISCHEEMYATVIQQNSVHAPFLENNCHACHEGSGEQEQAGRFYSTSHQSMQGAAQKISAGTSHGELQIKVDRAIELCLGCHADYQGRSSHPVNILPRRPMMIPADYPTSPEGRITCLTCHAAHGSNLNAMLRKSAEGELCLGCHSDKATDPPTMRYAAGPKRYRNS